MIHCDDTRYLRLTCYLTNCCDVTILSTDTFVKGPHMNEEAKDKAMGDDLFSMPEAVLYTGSTRMTLEKYHLRGDLPAQRTVGGSYIFRRADLDAVRAEIDAHKERFRTNAAMETRRKRNEGE